MRTAEPMFRFAHLSDPHLTDPSGASLRELAGKRLLGFLSWTRRRRHGHLRSVLDSICRDMEARAPDHTVVTGDLTHISLAREFLQARAWLESLGPAENITVIPGNHDAYVRIAWDASVGAWNDYMRSDPADGSSNDIFPSLRIRGPVAFIGLDSALPSPPFLATGSVGQRQRDRLKETLATLQGRRLLRVLLIHHPPVPGTEKWRKRLSDASQLCELLADTPVDMVLHGHQHRPGQASIRTRDRQIPVFGIASASSVGLHAAPASYNEYDVHPDGEGFQVEVKARNWCADTHACTETLIGRFDLPGS